MTKKERVLNAMQGKPVDKVPVSFWRHFTGAGSRFTNRQVAEQHLEFYQATDLDFIKIMYDGVPALIPEVPRTPSDLRKIRPVREEHPYVSTILDRAKWVTELLHDDVDTWMNLFSPFMILKNRGEEQMNYLLGEDRQAVIDALSAIGETVAYTVEKLLTECGCKGVFACFQGAEFTRFSKEDFNEIIRPSDMMVLNTANKYSDWNMAHFCAWDGGNNDLSRWHDYPARLVNWAVYMDHLTLPEGKKYFDNRPVMGGFDNRRGQLMYTGTKEEIQAETRRIVADYKAAAGSTDGLMIGADCSFLPPFDLEHFNWVSEALHQIAAEK